MKKIYFYGTVYGLLLYLLIEKNWKETYFCFSDKVSPDIVRYFKDNDINFYYDKNISNNCSAVNKILFKVYKKISAYLLILRFRFMGEEYYGFDDWYISRPFVGEKFSVIEDGLSNYLGIDRIKKSIDKKIMGYNGNYIPYGYDDCIKKVFLTGLLRIPNELKSKSIIIDIEGLWEEKNEAEKNEILKIFNITNAELKSYDKEIVLLTQPYEEYGVIDEAKKIDMYRRILKNYNLNNVIIKKHPKESTSYKIFFPECDHIEEKFPFELMLLLNKNIKKIITLSSTCAFNIRSNIEIDLYNKNGERKVINKEKIILDEILMNCFTVGDMKTLKEKRYTCWLKKMEKNLFYINK